MMDKRSRTKQTLGLMCIVLLVSIAPTLRSEITAGHLNTTLEDPLWIMKSSLLIKICAGYGFGCITSLSGLMGLSLITGEPFWKTKDKNPEQSLWQRISNFSEWLCFTVLILGMNCFFIFGSKTPAFSAAVSIGVFMTTQGLIHLIESSSVSDKDQNA